MTTRKRRRTGHFEGSEQASPFARSPADGDSSSLSPIHRKAQLTRREDKPPSSRRRSGLSRGEFEPPAGWPVYGVAAAVSAVWAAAPIAFAVGYRGDVAPFTDDAFAMAVFVLLVLGPAALVWVAAYMVRQGQRLAAETRRARSLTDEMIWPAVAAGLDAGDVVQAVREEILLAGEAAGEARETLLSLRSVLAAEVEKLAQATAASAQTAHGLAETLGRERTEMGALGQSLDAQAGKVADLITQQARMVAEASDLAETQLREAEAALAARAADLAAAAGEAGDAARNAGDDLNRHVARLETAGIGVAEQIRAVEGGLSEQRTSLVTLADALRGGHEDFANQAEAHATQLSEFIGQARLSAVEMGDRAVKGGEALRQLIAQANEQFQQLVDSARAERAELTQSSEQSLAALSQSSEQSLAALSQSSEKSLSTLSQSSERALAALSQTSEQAVAALSQSSGQSLAAFSEAAALERARVESQTRAAIDALARAAEETRTTTARHAEIARDQVDQLSEAAFAAGQKANQAFETRLSEARELIERSSEMVERTGETTARKLDEGAAAARATLEELQNMLSEIEQRAAGLPAAAQGHAEQVRAAVTASMDELMEQARRAAEETQAIDEAFQDRVQRNYQILSEAVRLMGSVAVAGGPVGLSATAPRTTAPAVRPPKIAPPEPPSPEPEPEAPKSEAPKSEAPKAEAPAPEVTKAAPVAAPVVKPEVSKAEKAGLRPRLRLTPTATDDEFSSVFEASGGKIPDEAGDTEGWTWKELLSSLDEGAGHRDPASLEAALVSEVAKLGIEPAELLSRDSVDEIAAAIQVGDADGAREIVRKLTPAAIRRIVRSLSTDEALTRQVARNLGLYKALLDDAAERDPEGFLVATLLGSDGGSAYLVLEAAVADLP